MNEITKNKKNSCVWNFVDFNLSCHYYYVTIEASDLQKHYELLCAIAGIFIS